MPSAAGGPVGGVLEAAGTQAMVVAPPGQRKEGGKQKLLKRMMVTNVYDRHLGARQTTHHQLLVLKPVVFFFVVANSFRSARRLEPSERRPIGLRVERVDHDGLRALNLTAAERAALALRLLVDNREGLERRSHSYYSYNYNTVGLYLPRRQTGSAHQVPAGLDLHVFVILGTDLAQLEGRSHLAVQLVLFLRAEEEAEGSVTFNSVWRR